MSNTLGTSLSNLSTTDTEGVPAVKPMLIFDIREAVAALPGPRKRMLRVQIDNLVHET
jgi:hypothetical protein